MPKQRNLNLTLHTWQNQGLGGYDTPASETGEVYHLLHGNGLCSRVLQPLAEQLEPEGQFLFTDVPGHGLSKQGMSHRPDWNQIAESIALSIEERSSSPVIGIGHSLGGILTLLAAAQHPKLFKRIILLDPVLFPPYLLLVQRFLYYSGLSHQRGLIRAVKSRRRSWSSRPRMFDSLASKPLYQGWEPEALSAFVNYGSVTSDTDGQCTLACDPEWEAAIFTSWPTRLWSCVRQVQCPLDILVASHTYPFVSQGAKKAAKQNKQVQVHYINGSHCFAMEAVAETAKRLSVIIGE